MSLDWHLTLVNTQLPGNNFTEAKIIRRQYTTGGDIYSKHPKESYGMPSCTQVHSGPHEQSNLREAHCSSSCTLAQVNPKHTLAVKPQQVPEFGRHIVDHPHTLLVVVVMVCESLLSVRV